MAPGGGTSPSAPAPILPAACGTGSGAMCSPPSLALPQVIQQPSKPGALIRPPQVTLTQTPMVALRQPHSRIMLTAPQQVQLSQLQPGEARAQRVRAGSVSAACTRATDAVCLCPTRLCMWNG